MKDKNSNERLNISTEEYSRVDNLDTADCRTSPAIENSKSLENLEDESRERKPVVVSLLKSPRADQNITMVSCDICGPGKLMKKHYLSVHRRTVHGERSVKCTHGGCSWKFKRVGDMRKHVQSVHQTEKKLCPICGESFKRVKEHIKIKHESERILCEFCDKVYYTESGLQYHLKVVHQKANKVGGGGWVVNNCISIQSFLFRPSVTSAPGSSETSSPTWSTSTVEGRKRRPSPAG